MQATVLLRSKRLFFDMLFTPPDSVGATTKGRPSGKLSTLVRPSSNHRSDLGIDISISPARSFCIRFPQYHSSGTKRFPR